MERVVFIDRDGVINKDLFDYVKTPAQFKFEEGAIEALKQFHDAGYKIIIVSNQAGIGDGELTEKDLQEVHEHMIKELRHAGVEIFSTQYCLHGKNAGCACRKPETGLFEEAQKKVTFEKSRTYFIGDKASDVEAGKRFGIKTAFVRTGHGTNDEVQLHGGLEPDLKADNLLDAAKALLNK